MGQMPVRAAERLRLGLGDGLDQQRDAAGALRLRARRHRRARQRQHGVPSREADRPRALTDPGRDRRRRHRRCSASPTSSTRATSAQALIDYLTDDGAERRVDLTDDDVRDRKLNGLFALVLQSPAYQLH